MPRMAIVSGWPGGFCRGPCFTALMWMSRYFVRHYRSASLFASVCHTVSLITNPFGLGLIDQGSSD